MRIFVWGPKYAMHFLTQVKHETTANRGGGTH